MAPSHRPETPETGGVLPLGGYEERRKKLQEERHKEYNRLIAQVSACDDMSSSYWCLSMHSRVCNIHSTTFHSWISWKCYSIQIRQPLLFLYAIYTCIWINSRPFSIWTGSIVIILHPVCASCAVNTVVVMEYDAYFTIHNYRLLNECNQAFVCNYEYILVAFTLSECFINKPFMVYTQ